MAVLLYCFELVVCIGIGRLAELNSKISDEIALSASVREFVLHCGEMARYWGFNRTVGQMLGLIIVTEQPLSAQTIADTLSISRGNVSMSIKEMLSWQLIKVLHEPGDRKEYYTLSGSIWHVANKVFEERKRRELDPTFKLLRNSMQEMRESNEDSYALERMSEIHDLLETVSLWAEELQGLDEKRLHRLVSMGESMLKILKLKDRLSKF